MSAPSGSTSGSSAADKAKRERPLSPHLQIYKPQITSVTSILHRATGVALALGLFVLGWGLIALASGEGSYAVFKDFWGSIFGMILLFGWSFAFFYHFCCGLRHLVMDTGRMMDIKGMYKAAYITYAGALVLTMGTWIVYFACSGY